MIIPEPITPHTEPAAPTVRRSWWRRNALALVVVAVLIPATALVIGGRNWYESYGYGNLPYKPIMVEEKGDAEFVGATFGPVRSGLIEDLTGFDVPPDAKVIAAAVPVHTGAEGVSCSVVLVEQKTGREWRPSRTEIGLMYDPDEPEYCTTADIGDYELIVPFVVPEDAEGPFWVDVRSPGELSGGSFLRFSIDP